MSAESVPNFDIFEIVGKDRIRRDSVSGHDAAIARMGELARASGNEFRLVDSESNAVIAATQIQLKRDGTHLAFKGA